MKSLLWSMVVILTMGTGAWADRCDDCGCTRPAVRQAADVASSYKSEAFSLTLPAGWSFMPARGEGDFAKVRFERENPHISGMYQIYEGAATTDPELWYRDARARYESLTPTMAGVDKIEVSDLEKTTMGGQEAWSFGFVVAFKNGPPVATRIVFTPRTAGVRRDMHEIVVTGDATTMAKRGSEVDSILKSVKFGG
jgi:hypothetical protein